MLGLRWVGVLALAAAIHVSAGERKLNPNVWHTGTVLDAHDPCFEADARQTLHGPHEPILFGIEDNRWAYLIRSTKHRPPSLIVGDSVRFSITERRFLYRADNGRKLEKVVREFYVFDHRGKKQRME